MALLLPLVTLLLVLLAPLLPIAIPVLTLLMLARRIGVPTLRVALRTVAALLLHGLAAILIVVLIVHDQTPSTVPRADGGVHRVRFVAAKWFPLRRHEGKFMMPARRDTC